MWGNLLLTVHIFCSKVVLIASKVQLFFLLPSLFPISGGEFFFLSFFLGMGQVLLDGQKQRKVVCAEKKEEGGRQGVEQK